MPSLHRADRLARSRGRTPARPPLPAIFAVLIAGMAALVIMVAGGGSAAATAVPCQAAVEAGASPLGTLSTPLEIEIMCDATARVEVRAPGASG